MAGTLRKTLVYLGLAVPVSGPGYRIGGTSRERYQVCERCGARVEPSEEDVHNRWHHSLGR